MKPHGKQFVPGSRRRREPRAPEGLKTLFFGFIDYKTDSSFHLPAKERNHSKTSRRMPQQHPNTEIPSSAEEGADPTGMSCAVARVGASL